LSEVGLSEIRKPQVRRHSRSLGKESPMSH
jgi:hypothetical protein